MVQRECSQNPLQTGLTLWVGARIARNFIWSAVLRPWMHCPTRAHHLACSPSIRKLFKFKIFLNRHGLFHLIRTFAVHMSSSLQRTTMAVFASKEGCGWWAPPNCLADK